MQVTYNVKLNNERIFFNLLERCDTQFESWNALTVLTQKQIHKGHYTFMYASTDYDFRFLLFEAV